MFKLSSIYSSFVNNNRQDKAKQIVNQSQMVNPLYIKNKLKENNVLLVNEELDKNKEKDINKFHFRRDLKLNEIEKIKEEEESIQEDENESDGKKVKFNLNNKKEKEQERKSDKPNLKNTMRFGKDIKDFYSNSIMFRICGSMQVFNYLNRNEDEDDLFGNEDEVEEEEVISANYKNVAKEQEDIKSNDNNKKD